jgi:site-specific DNA-cytosine methylase
MRVLDLFSCVGCHALGFGYVGRFETVAFCESRQWRRDVLVRNFPEVPIHDDVRTIKAPGADICIGGPPCQATSVAAAVHGKRSGASLWSFMLKAGLDAGVEWFVVEQPPGHAAWEAQVAGDLSDAGFHVGRLEFSAADVGAPYLRRRVFMVACADLSRLEVAWEARPRAIDEAARAAVSRGDWNPDSIPGFGMASWRAEGVHDRRERIEALGDSNPPAMAEVIGRMIGAAA